MLYVSIGTTGTAPESIRTITCAGFVPARNVEPKETSRASGS